MPRQETSADLPQGLVAGGAVSDRLLILLKKNFLHFRRERKLPDS